MGDQENRIEAGARALHANRCGGCERRLEADLARLRAAAEPEATT